MTATMEGVGTTPAPDLVNSGYVYAVITKVPGDLEYGNRAIPFDSIMVDAQAFGGAIDDPPTPLVDVLGGNPMVALMLRVVVFRLGEIVILDSEYGREVIAPGRKPSKWSVDVEHFANVVDAISRSQDVTRDG